MTLEDPPMSRFRILLAVVCLLSAVLPASALAANPPASPVRLGYCGGDDWEPTLARSGSLIVVAITHYVGDPSCDTASANPHAIYVQTSNDGGATWTAPHAAWLAPIGGVAYSKQADPSLAIDASGNVYLSWLGYGVSGGHTDVIVAKSTDGGASWTQITKVNTHDCKNCDHEKLVAAPSGIYLAYTQASNHYIARSADGGATWTQSTVLKNDVVAFAEGGVVDAQGNVVYAWADCRSSACTGAPAVDFRVSRTTAGTLATTFSDVATAVQGPDCPFSKCGFAYWSPQDTIAIDAAGTLYLAAGQGQSPTTRKSPPIVDLFRSSDGGSTWSALGRIDDKTASGCAGGACYALYPTVIAGAAGSVSVAWMDDRAGSPIDHTNGWNVWLRSSTDGGATWSAASTKVSAYDAAQAQSQPNGFGFPYGDYFGLGIGSCGSPILTWGEGINWAGSPSMPGHVEFRSMC
jgi:hypothetical protein